MWNPQGLASDPSLQHPPCASAPPGSANPPAFIPHWNRNNLTTTHGPHANCRGIGANPSMAPKPLHSYRTCNPFPPHVLRHQSSSRKQDFGHPPKGGGTALPMQGSTRIGAVRYSSPRDIDPPRHSRQAITRTSIACFFLEPAELPLHFLIEHAVRNAQKKEPAPGGLLN